MASPVRRSRAKIFPGCGVFTCLVPDARRLRAWDEEGVNDHQYLLTVLGKSRKHKVVKEFLVDFGAIPYDSPRLVRRFLVGFEDDRRRAQFEKVLDKIQLDSHKVLGFRTRQIGRFPETVIGEGRFVKPKDSPPHSAHVVLRFEPTAEEGQLEFLFPDSADIFPSHDKENYLAEIHRGLVYAMHRGVDWGIPFGGLKATFMGGTFNALSSRPLSFRYAAANSLESAINNLKVIGKDLIVT